jgi:uncharacterized membrane protein YkoI
MKTLNITALVAGSLIMFGAVQAQEKKVKMQDLPEAVQKTVKEQSKNATLKGLSSEVENGKTEYEAEFTVNGHSRDITIDPQGNVMEVEEEVALSSLPAAVQKGLKDAAGKGQILKIESISKDGKLEKYEALVKTAGKKSEIQMDTDGKLIRKASH